MSIDMVDIRLEQMCRVLKSIAGSLAGIEWQLAAMAPLQPEARQPAHPASDERPRRAGGEGA